MNAQSTPNLARARRGCRLVLIANSAVNHVADSGKIARVIREYDPLIPTTIIGDRRRGLAQLLPTLAAPTLVIFLVPLARFRPLCARFLHDINLSRSEEYSRPERRTNCNGKSIP